MADNYPVINVVSPQLKIPLMHYELALVASNHPHHMQLVLGELILNLAVRTALHRPQSMFQPQSLVKKEW